MSSAIDEAKFHRATVLFVSWVQELGEDTREIKFSTDNMGSFHVTISDKGEEIICKDDCDPEVAILEASLELSLKLREEGVDDL